MCTKIKPTRIFSLSLCRSLRFGRRSVLIWSYLQLGVLGCSSALSPSYSAYCVFRFLSGMAVSGVILNGVSLSTCLAVYLSVCLPVCHKLQVESLMSRCFIDSLWKQTDNVFSEVDQPVCSPVCLFTCLSVYLSVSRGGVDPNQREDVSGHSHLLLLHLWSDDSCRARLLAERLEEAAGGRLCPPVPIFCLWLVSVHFQNKCLQSFCSLVIWP